MSHPCLRRCAPCGSRRKLENGRSTDRWRHLEGRTIEFEGGVARVSSRRSLGATRRDVESPTEITLDLSPGESADEAGPSGVGSRRPSASPRRSCLRSRFENGPWTRAAVTSGFTCSSRSAVIAPTDLGGSTPSGGRAAGESSSSGAVLPGSSARTSSRGPASGASWSTGGSPSNRDAATSKDSPASGGSTRTVTIASVKGERGRTATASSTRGRTSGAASATSSRSSRATARPTRSWRTRARTSARTDYRRWSRAFEPSSSESAWSFASVRASWPPVGQRGTTPSHGCHAVRRDRARRGVRRARDGALCRGRVHDARGARGPSRSQALRDWRAHRAPAAAHRPDPVRLARRASSVARRRLPSRGDRRGTGRIFVLHVPRRVHRACVHGSDWARRERHEPVQAELTVRELGPRRRRGNGGPDRRRVRGPSRRYRTSAAHRKSGARRRRRHAARAGDARHRLSRRTCVDDRATVELRSRFDGIERRGRPRLRRHPVFIPTQGSAPCVRSASRRLRHG